VPASPKLSIRDFGPFAEAELEVKPITVIVGRNNSGKSTLVYLFWSLVTREASILHGNELKKAVESVAGEADVVYRLEKAAKSRDISLMSEVVDAYVKALLELLASDISRRFRRVFPIESVSELVRLGRDEARIRVEGEKAFVEVSIRGDKVSIEGNNFREAILKNLRAEMGEDGSIALSFGNSSVTERWNIVSPEKAHYIFGKVLLSAINAFLYPFFSLYYPAASLFIDSRAGLARILPALRNPSLNPQLVAESAVGPGDYFAQFYEALTDALCSGAVDPDILAPLLSDLGIGVYCRSGKIYVKSWSGLEKELYYASSGIRESITVAISLATKMYPFTIVEEPEAHLHPSAQVTLAKTIAKAVNRFGKTVVITTHSPYMLYALNNLIIASKNPSKARRLGIEEEEMLKPEHVAAYLIEPSDGKAELKRLKVSDEGVPEDEFERVVNELEKIRSKLSPWWKRILPT